MQIITPIEALNDLPHKAARLIINRNLGTSPGMHKTDSAAVEKETVSAEILRKGAVKRTFAVSRISDNGMRKMFEVPS